MLAISKAPGSGIINIHKYMWLEKQQERMRNATDKARIY